MNEEKDKKIAQQLYPTWRKVFLETHKTLATALNFVWSPVRWVTEKFDGTAHWKEMDQREETKK